MGDNNQDEDLIGDLLALRNEAEKEETKPRDNKVQRGLRRIGAIPDAPRKKAAAEATPRPPKQINATLSKQGLLFNLFDILQCINMDQYLKLQESLTHTHTLKNGRRTVGQVVLRLFRIHTVGGENGQTRRLFACARFCGIQRLLRNVCTKYDLRVKIENKILPGIDIPPRRARCGIYFTENQQLVFDYLMTNIYSPERRENGSSGCVFVMDTGHGKSYIAAKLIAKLAKKTLLVLPSQSLMGGWENLFAKWLPDLRVGKYYGREKVDGDVILTVINSTLSDMFYFIGQEKIPWVEFMNQFGLVIYDEIHNYPTAGRQEIFWRCGARCILGMTATPDERLDNMDMIYAKHIGPFVNAPEVPGYNNDEITWKGEVKVIHYHGHPDYTKRIMSQLETTNTTGMYKQFCADPYRNQLVLEEILSMQAEGLDVFCFSEHREYIEYLYGLLQVNGMRTTAPELAKGTVTRLIGGSTIDDHENAKKTQIILVTYAYAKEGISIVKMNGIIFTTPRRNKMKQILGRILRRGGDPSIVRRIVDITDADTTLRSQLPTRKIEYARRGFPVKDVQVSWKQFERRVKLEQVKTDVGPVVKPAVVAPTATVAPKQAHVPAAGRPLTKNNQLRGAKV